MSLKQCSTCEESATWRYLDIHIFSDCIQFVTKFINTARAIIIHVTEVINFLIKPAHVYCICNLNLYLLLQVHV